MKALSILRTKKLSLLVLTALSILVSIGISRSNEAAALTTSTVLCQGNLCTPGGGGSMNREYSYLVTPNKIGGINRLDFGVDSNTPLISGIVAPPGWSYVYNNPDTTNHRIPWTANGTVFPSNGTCPMVMRWTGPPMTNQFEIAFNGPNNFHNVEWDTSDGSVAAWAQPVGMGLGPVHAHRFGWVPVSSEEDAGAGPHAGSEDATLDGE